MAAKKSGRAGSKRHKTTRDLVLTADKASRVKGGKVAGGGTKSSGGNVDA
jgi:hypothetical protein